MGWGIKFTAIAAAVLLHLANPAEARPKKLANAACPKLDYRTRFPPSKYQGELGTCYAFVATALLAEQLCLERKELCGKPLSVVDVSRCAGFSLQGGFTSSTLRCALEAGACLDKYAPYAALPEKNDTRRDRFLKTSRVSARNLAKSSACARNRITMEHATEVYEENLEGLESEKKLERLKTVMESGQSAGLSLRLPGPNFHAVAVVGMRHNVIKGQCEIWVRDSDGEDDWHPALGYLAPALRIFWAK